MKKAFIKFLYAVSVSMYVFMKLQKKWLRKAEVEKEKANRNNVLYNIMNFWLMLMQKGTNIAEYFEKHGYHDIAIYGINNLGERLYDALYGTDVHVRYGIDKNADQIFTTFKVYKPTEGLEKVDAIIVTAVNYFSEVERELSKKVVCPIISMKTVISELLET